MNTDIFRFVVIRSPILSSAEKLEDEPLKVGDWIGESSTFYDDLKDIVNQNGARAEVVEFAESFLEDQKFDLELSNMNFPILDLEKWLSIKPEHLSIAELTAGIEEIFGYEDIDQLVNSVEFQGDMSTVSNGLIAISAAEQKTNPLRSLLLNAARLFYLILEVAQSEKSEMVVPVTKWLKRSVLLPSDVFPLPTDEEERKRKVEEARQKENERVKEKKVELEALTLDLNENKSAIEELSRAYEAVITGKRIEAARIDAKPPEEKVYRTYNGFFQKSLRFLGISPTTSWSETEEVDSAFAVAAPTVLPPEAYSKLSDTTKAALSRMNVSAEFVDVPVAVEQLEAKNANIAHLVNLNQAAYAGFDLFKDSPGSGLVPGPCKPVPEEAAPEGVPFFPLTDSKVNRIGVAELMIVRQELLHYETEEIAHIENILKGEHKERQHRSLKRTEEVLVEETETIQEEELDLQTSEKFELQSEAEKVINSQHSVDAGLTVSFSWGPVESTAYGNYAYSRSQTNSRNTATNFARDVISRSVQRIQERVLSRRSRTTIQEVEEINTHGIDNKEGEGHITGIYRWVNKIYKAQVVNYGLRTILEFIIPEPAAFFKYVQVSRPLEGEFMPKPEPPGFCTGNTFRSLQPRDITEFNYQYWVGKYGVKDVQPPPPKYKRVSFSFKDQFQVVEAFNSNNGKTSKHSLIQFKEDLAMPNNYRAKDAWIKINGLLIGAWKVDILLGNHRLINRQGSPKLEATLNDEEGSVPLAVYARNVITFGMTIEIQTERNPNLFAQWQIDTYNAIIISYNDLLSQYEEEVAARKLQEGIVIEGRNPLTNRAIEQTELKKLVLSQLTGQNYESFDSIIRDPTYGYPEMNLTASDLEEEGKIIQFFETSLEWINMTYLFYPYFWSSKADWPKNSSITDNDPLFEKFLQAGAARVQVPIRLGFEELILNYIQSGGTPWEGENAPQFDNENKDFVLSMLEEIKEQMGVTAEARTGTIEVVNGANEVVGTGTDFSEQDTDREIIIALKSYRIAEVISETEILLREPYSGESQSELGFSIGVKFVGEPWTVTIPTNLVYLQQGSEL